MQFVRIPEERVNVLIGRGGATKRRIESKTNCNVEVEGNEVSVEGDSVDEWRAKDVVHAIGRGFNPDKALMLVRDDQVFEYIELKDYANTPKSMERLKGRIIGEKGRTRRFIERNTGAMVSVYGKTVAFIGGYDQVSVAVEACSMLLTGKRHSTVYRYIEKHGRRGV